MGRERGERRGKGRRKEEGGGYEELDGDGGGQKWVTAAARGGRGRRRGEKGWQWAI